ncbi:---NA---, partial [Paramuricea clavata]
VWDLLDGLEITGIVFDSGVKLVRFVSDWKADIIGCNNNRFFIWDWQNNDVKLVTLPSSFTTIAEIACDGNMIYTCCENMEVCQIDLGSLKVSTIHQGPYPNCRPVVVLPDGKATLHGILPESSFIYWEHSTDGEITCNA